MVRKSKGKKLPEHSWSKVAFRAVDGILNLINTNRIYPLFGVLILFLIGLIVWKLPESDLGNILTVLVNEFVVDKGGMIAIILISNILWWYIFNRMRSLYKDEIDRLANIRSHLMHDNDKIEDHRSTNDECKETHILPVDPKGK